jgi:hypothetical protein
MADEARRHRSQAVPGAAGRAPGSANRLVLPGATMKQMQAAVDAARMKQDDGPTHPRSNRSSGERTAERATPVVRRAAAIYRRPAGLQRPARSVAPRSRPEPNAERIRSGRS